MIAQPHSQTLALPARTSFELGRTWNLPLLVAHVPLGILMSKSSMIVTAHAYGVVLLALAFALKRTTIDKATYLICYIGCCDVLWRMNGASFPWEGGKYAVLLLCVVAWSHERRITSSGKLALLMAFLLVPSSFKTVSEIGLNESARQAISFNVSGMVTTTAAILFFSTIPSNRISIESILKAMVAPVLAILAVASTSTLSAASISFNNEANFTTSGGYGPNQVSSLLGLGVLASLILTLRAEKNSQRLIWFGIMGVLFLQATLTFSRGGVLNVVLAASVLGLHYMASRGSRHVYFAPIALVVVSFWLFLPVLGTFTDGAFGARFTSTNTTGRAEIGTEELEMWAEHPIFGTGPGLAARHRTVRHGAASHTEYTRLLSEHGSFGMGVILALLAIVAVSYLKAPSLMTRAWVAMLGVWCLASLMHTAMRFSAVSILFGLITLEWRRWYLPRRGPS